MPSLDRGRVHAQVIGYLGDAELARRPQPVIVTRELMAAAQMDHDPRGESLVVAGAMSFLVEDLRSFKVGVVLEELIEASEGGGVGLMLLPRSERDRDGQAGDLTSP